VKHLDVQIGTVTEDRGSLAHLVKVGIGVHYVKINVSGRIANSAVKIKGFVPLVLPDIGDILARGNVQ
jgi:hypothetical protein